MTDKAKRGDTYSWRTILSCLVLAAFLLTGLAAVGFIVLLVTSDSKRSLDQGECAAALKTRQPQPVHQTAAQFDDNIPDTQTITFENANHLEEVVRLGQGNISSAFWDADGNLLVFTTVGLWQYLKNQLFEPPELLWTQPFGFEETFASQSGRSLALQTHSYPKSIPVFDTTTGTYTLMEAGGSSGGLMETLVFSSDDRLMAAAIGDDVHLWELETGAHQIFSDYSGLLRDVVFSPDNRWLVALGSDTVQETQTSFKTRIRVWDMDTSQLALEISPDVQIDQIAFYPDNNHLVGFPASREESGVLSWSIPLGEAVPDLSIPTRLPATLSADQRYVAYGNQIYDRSTEERIAVLPKSYYFSVHFSPDSKWIAYVSAYPVALSLIEIDQPDKIHQMSVAMPQVAFSHIEFRDNLVIEGFDKQPVMNAQKTRLMLWEEQGGSDSGFYGRLCNAQTGEQVLYVGNKAPVVFSHSGRALALKGGYYQAELRSSESGEVIHADPSSDTSNSSSVTSFAFSPDDTILAVARGDFNQQHIQIDLIRVDTWEVLQTLPIHASLVRAMAFNDSGTLLASFSDDNTVRLWGVPIE